MQSVFGIGETELVLILLFAFMVFGPDKLPGMGRTIGRALRQFRHAQEGFTQVVQSEIVDPAAEAMSANPKKPNRDRTAETDEDSDLDIVESTDTASTNKTETFAERKKRLAAEHLAAQKAAETKAEQVADDSSADASAEQADTANVMDKKKASEEETPAAPSAADLYAMSPTHTTDSRKEDGESEA